MSPDKIRPVSEMLWLKKKTWKLDIIQIISQKGNFSTSCKTSETAVKTSYTEAANVVCSSQRPALRPCDGEICLITEQQAHKKQQILNICSNAYPLALSQKQVYTRNHNFSSFQEQKLWQKARPSAIKLPGNKHELPLSSHNHYYRHILPTSMPSYTYHKSEEGGTKKRGSKRRNDCFRWLSNFLALEEKCIKWMKPFLERILFYVQE